MTEKDTIIAATHREYLRIREKRPTYSLRSFARRLGVSPATLSGVMRGRLTLTKRMGDKFLKGIHFDSSESARLLSTLSNKKPGPNTLDDNYVLLDMEQYHLISDWYYFGILSLSETRGFRGEPAWVANRLGITLTQAKTALKRLEQLSLLTRDSAGALKHGGKPLRTTSGVPNQTIRRSHMQSLKLARQSLKHDALGECDFSASTLVIHPKKIKEAKAMLKDFRRRFARRMEAGEKTEVYRLCLLFFPLTKLHTE